MSIVGMVLASLFLLVAVVLFVLNQYGRAGDDNDTF